MPLSNGNFHKTCWGNLQGNFSAERETNTAMVKQQNTKSGLKEKRKKKARIWQKELLLLIFLDLCCSSAILFHLIAPHFSSSPPLSDNIPEANTMWRMHSIPLQPNWQQFGPGSRGALNYFPATTFFLDLELYFSIIISYLYYQQ